MAIFGEHLRESRKLRSLSQVQLAELCGVSQTRISDLELGKSDPSYRDLARLRDVLDLDAAALAAQLVDSYAAA